MKKIVSLLLVLILALSVCTACGNKEKDYSLAIGVAVSGTLTNSKVSETVAAIVTDADGKIVLCRLDSVEYSAWKSGAVNTTVPTSKVAQGDNYDPNNYMPAGDWYKQAEALEKYVVGKTQAEVAAITTDAQGKTELVAGCTIGITDLLKAIDNAFKSEHKVAFTTAAEALTAGLSVVGTVKDTSKEEPASTNAKHSATFSCAVLADGKVVAAILDTAEPELVGIDAEGKATSLNYKGTKREQGEDYDPNNYMAAGDWYKQADAYAKAAIGKSASDISTLATEGVAGCTIGVTEYKAGLEAAVKAAK